MTVHCVRDFLSSPTAVCPTANMYYVTLFLTGVLGFTRVGQTSMNIVPEQKGTVADNLGASINLGYGKEYYVMIPTASYIVPESADNNKILVLKSVDNPLVNSGLFRILSSSVPDNAYIVDYRTPGGVYPPSEFGSWSGSLDWMVFANESSFGGGSYVDNNAGGYNYQTTGAACTYPRTILQSPVGWQVRICAEGADDRWNVGGWNTGNTFSVGLGGDSRGDFPVGGQHTHGGQFWNYVEPSFSNGRQVGCDPYLGDYSSWVTSYWRVYMWGDDETGSLTMFNREYAASTCGNPMLLFGMPENEPLPTPASMAHRVFVIGDSNQNRIDGPSWHVATKNEYTYSGQAFGFCNQPITVTLTPYMFTWPTNGEDKPRTAVTKDNPVLKATELMPVEITAGTLLNNYVQSAPFQQNIPLEPRRMGTVPFIKLGRTNFGNWTTSSDNRWIHMMNGMYGPWGGLAALP